MQTKKVISSSPLLKVKHNCQPGDPGPGLQALGSSEAFGICSEGKPSAHTGLPFYSPSLETHTRSPLLHNLCPQRAEPGIHQ